MKRMLSILLSTVIVFSMSIPVLAEEMPTTDISEEYYTETEYISYKDMYTPYSEELGEPIGQVIQTVYVKETFDDNISVKRLHTATPHHPGWNPKSVGQGWW